MPRIVFVFIVVISFKYNISANAQSALPGSKCQTPNGEDATCTSFYSCKPILTAIESRVEGALEFSKQSHCVSGGTFSVCCGTQGTFTENIKPMNQAAQINKRDLLANKQLCGIQSKDDRFETRKFTQIDEYPWMAVLFYKNDLDETAVAKCAGSLINRRYVLTAAQCLRQRNDKLTFVRLGEYDTSSTGRDCVENPGLEECTDPPTDVAIEEVIVHEDYEYSGSNDIGLIRLAKAVSYSDFIRPICLPDGETNFFNIGREIVTSGWGSIVHNEQATSVKKNQSNLIVDFAECNKVWMNENTDTEKFVCLKHTINGPCSGDGGGPMMSAENLRWHQLGIVAAGSLPCGNGSVTWGPRIDRYMDWIIKNLKP